MSYIRLLERNTFTGRCETVIRFNLQTNRWLIKLQETERFK